MGACTTPTTGRPSATSATETPTTGKPCTKLAVPSSGSTNKPTSARSPPVSSPKNASAGAASCNRSRIACSLDVSASLTQSPGPFVRTLLASPKASSTIAAPAAAPRIAAASNASRSRSTLTARSLPGDRGAGPWFPRRSADAAPARRARPVRVLRRRRRARRPRGTRAARRGSPTARAGRRGRRGTRRDDRRRRRTARARPSPAHGIAATRVAPAASRRARRPRARCRWSVPARWLRGRAARPHPAPRCSARWSHRSARVHTMGRRRRARTRRSPSTGCRARSWSRRPPGRAPPRPRRRRGRSIRIPRSARARRPYAAPAAPRRRPRGRGGTGPLERCEPPGHSRSASPAPRAVRQRRRRTPRADRRASSRGLHGDDRVVVGHARRRIPPAGAEQHVALGEEHLHVSGTQAALVQARAHLAVVGADDDTIAVAQPQALDVGGGHEQGVAHRAGEWVLLLVDHGVELLAAASAEHEAPRRHVDLRRRDGEEAGPSVGSGERPAFAQARPAPLDRVTGGAQELDPRVHGHHARDLVADLLPRREGALLGPLGRHPPCELDEDLPLAAHLTRSGAFDLGAVRDPALRGGLGAAVALLVPSGRGQEHDDLA